ncbi:COL Colipase, partial [Dromaius novaehollandiae]|nr:COL Colipase [Dromaius novaehollandiae]
PTMARALLLCLLLVASALASPLASEQGLIFNLDTEELCLQSIQCKSGCCYRSSALSLARCMPKAAETQECSPQSIYSVYYKCPCESGLTCDADGSLLGAITNTNFGVCKDPGDAEQR